MAHDNKVPNKDITGSKGLELQGKLILLGVSGSPAAVEAVEIARELMRHGAEVIPIMTPASAQLIHPNLLEWATGNSPVTELTGRIEHILYTHQTGRPADLYLIAPCTGNTIGKIVAGIDDTPVTSTATAALGEKIPIMIAPAMHDSMWRNPFILENLRRIRSAKIDVIEPRIEEGKAKIADVETIVEAVLTRLSNKDLAGKRVLITAGPTVEYFDPIRIITNKSSGKMGTALARAAVRRGGQVTFVYGPGQAPPPKGIETIRVETTEEMLRTVTDFLRRQKYDLTILSAAASDYAPSARSSVKIASKTHKRLKLTLKATPKILDQIKKLNPSTFLIAFKAEYNVKERDLVDRGFHRLRESEADMIAVNDVAQNGVGFGEDTNEVLLVDSDHKVVKIGLALKDDVARRVLDEALTRMKIRSHRREKKVAAAPLRTHKK